MTRPVWEIPVGRFSILERVELLFSQPISFVSRFQSEPQSGWFLNGSFIWETNLLPEKEEAWFIGDIPVVFFEEGLSQKDFADQKQLAKILLKKKKKQIQGIYLKYIFDYIKYQNQFLLKDLKNQKQSDYNFSQSIVIGDKNKIAIHPQAKVWPGSVFDTREGEIFIDHDAEIIPPSLIQGPCYIGKKVLIDAAKIRPNNSFFEGCKISGEVADSIFLEYVNKHHDGFIGHSLIGSFVNFGAMSTNSDLKNNYSSIKVFLNGEWIDSGEIKIGIFSGDHSKFGIGSLMNSGSIFGTGCNLFSNQGLFPKFVPSFSWGNGIDFKKYVWNDFLENTKKILKRRKKELSHEMILRLKQIYDSIEVKKNETGF